MEWLHCSVGITVLPDMVARNAWMETFITPAVFWFVDPAKSRFILEHKTHFSIAFVDIIQLSDSSFIFFEASMTASSAFRGCLLRGMTFRQPMAMQNIVDLAGTDRMTYCLLIGQLYFTGLYKFTFLGSFLKGCENCSFFLKAHIASVSTIVISGYVRKPFIPVYCY